MSYVDAAWLGMESPVHPMVVTALLRFDRALDPIRLATVLQERLVERYPKFAMRVLPPRTAFDQPVWVDDLEFDLGRHVVDAGRVDGEAGLAALVNDVLGAPLDMRHSPWQFHLVHLPGEVEGRTAGALVARVHHSVGDGIALAGALLSLADDRPGIPAYVGKGADGGERDLPRVLGVDTLVPRSVGQAVRSARIGLDVLRTGLELIASRDPRTGLRGRLGAAKAAAWSAPIDLGMLKRVAGGLDASVNDVLVGVIAGALRRHLVDLGDQPHDLHIYVPVDLRRGGPVAPELGNRVGLVQLKLPVSLPDPVARVREVHRRMTRLKASGQAASTYAILSIVGALPSWANRLAVWVGVRSSAAVTNVPGPARPVYLAGARLSRLAFWVPQVGGVGLGVSIISYAGEVTIGVAADRNIVPEPGRLVDAVEAEIADLVALSVAVDPEQVELEEVPFDSEIAESLIAEVQQEYVKRYGGHDETPVDPKEFAPPHGRFLVARVGAVAIGCAGLRRHDDSTVEVKRMFVRPEHRRKGHARRLLAALEESARSDGYRRVVLETGLAQPEAIALYVSAGYRPIEGFGHYKDAPLSRSFARDI